MTSLSQIKINADYSAYRNYSKKQKKNILLNKVQVDPGYFQDVFADKKSYQSHDYIQDNKKNLKNFFKDRLPEDKIKENSFRTKTINFDPMRMFEIKRQQFELKNQTKMQLNGNVFQRKQRSKSVQSKEIEKISQIFFVNDKTLEFKKKFGSLNIQRFDSYSKDNYRRGTRSFMQKKSSILKKQAYQKVFGLDISSVSRTLPVTPNLQLQSIQKSKMRNSKKKRQQAETSKAKKEDLSKLIKKIQDFKNKIKPVKLNYDQQELEGAHNSNTEGLLNLSGDQRNAMDQSSTEQREKVLQLIQNITTMYKGQAIQENRTKLSSIEDLQQLDSEFYFALNEHKKSRMQKRMYELYKYSTPESNQLISSNLNIDNHHSSKIHQHRINRRQPSDILTISDHADNQSIILQTMQTHKMSVHQRFRYLGTHLVKAYLQANFYLVKHMFLYPAFWEQKQPFKTEGSYAFYKAIKFNDFQCIKSFIHIDQKYLYQVDMNGKTPLIYACQYNKQQIVSYLLQHGCNVDKTCHKKKTALFYALQNENIEIVTRLLQFGADPWSSNDCPYKKMLKRINKEPFQIAFSNAKKIYLAVRLQIGSKRRAQFWHQNKHRINYQHKIQF